MKSTENLFDNIPSHLPEELYQTLLINAHCKIERIVSRGHATPQDEWFDQDWDEWVLLLKGEAELVFENGERLTMQSGDYMLIPARQKHRVAWTTAWQDSVWLVVHLNQPKVNTDR